MRTREILSGGLFLAVGIVIGIQAFVLARPPAWASAEPVECYSEQAVIEFARLAVAAERDGPAPNQLRFERKVEARGD